MTGEQRDVGKLLARSLVRALFLGDGFLVCLQKDRGFSWAACLVNSRTYIKMKINNDFNETINLLEIAIFKFFQVSVYELVL